MKKIIPIDNAEVNIFYKKGDKTAKTIINETEDGFRKAGRYFGIKLENDIQIRLVYSRKEFDKYSDKKTENWMIGRALKDGKDIIIFSPSVVAKYSDKDKDYPLSKTIRHEIAHLYMRQEGFVPWWLDEGLAFTLANQPFQNYGKEKSKQLLKSGRMFSYSQEDCDYCMSHGGYAASGFITKLILKDLGKKKVIKLIKNNCRSNTFKDFFEREMGTTQSQYIEKLIAK